MTGKLIVFEGTDGSGKSTQFKMLCDRLSVMETSFQTLVFPQYKEPSSALIRMYLGGEFGGKPEDVNPYAATAFYAVDRYASLKKVWGEYYNQGGLVLADRYTSSNAVHQAAKCPSQERTTFFKWLDDFEHEKMGLPRADAVIYLDMPTEQAVQLLRHREADTNTKADIHEMDVNYLATCRESAREASDVLGWHRVSCVDESSNIRSIPDIHSEIWGILERIVFEV